MTAFFLSLSCSVTRCDFTIQINEGNEFYNHEKLHKEKAFKYFFLHFLCFNDNTFVTVCLVKKNVAKVMKYFIQE